MVKKLNHAQKRGLLIVLGALVLVAGWRWRASQAGRDADQLAAATEETASNVKSAERIELNAADTTVLQTVKGIGPVIARRIVRYRALVGGFTSTEQLLKVWGITPESFIRIEEQVFVDTTTGVFATLKKGKYAKNERPQYAGTYPRYARRAEVRQYAEVASEPPMTSTASSTLQPTAAPTTNRVPNVPPKSIDLNTADSIQLVEVSGIGPATARNIIKYRSLIWFFDSLDQLAEVWGVRPENLERMMPYLTIGDSKKAMPHIKVNEMTVDEMGRHKYLGFKEARILVAYREMHGPFTNFESLQKVHGIAPEKMQKLQPYLLY